MMFFRHIFGIALLAASPLVASSFSTQLFSRGVVRNIGSVSGGTQLWEPQQRTTKSRLSAVVKKGCAAKPFEKKKIAVFGAGGYLGATVFGFLQRASSLYGTGIASISSPCAICATGTGLEALNKVLLTSFTLAFAGEDLVRLVDATDSSHIGERLKGFDAAIIGTTYQLEKRAVTGNTYEKGPNDKAYEFYLDERYGARTDGAPGDDSDFHVEMFAAAVQACKAAGGIQHLVVLETARTSRPADFVDILEQEGIPYTYVRIASPLTKDKSYSFDKGIGGDFKIRRLAEGLEPLVVDDAAPPCPREDVAAIIVQSLMTLDWKESRAIEVKALGTLKAPVELTKDEKRAKAKQKFDKEWCPNSEKIAEILVSM